MQRRTFFTYAFLLGSTALPLVSYALNLNEALTQTLAQNQSLKSAREDLTVAAELQRQALGSFLPDFSASAGWHARRIEADNAVSGVDHPRTGGVTITQDLFNGALIPAYAGAKAYVVQEQATYESTVQTTLLSTVQAYTKVLVAEEIARQQENLVESLTRQKEAAEVRFQQGDATKTDIAQAEARLAAAKAQWLSAKNTIKTTRHSLAVVLGQDTIVAEALHWPNEEALLALVEQTQLADPLDVMETHPTGRKSTATEAVQKANIRVSQAGFMPELTANASYTRSEGSQSAADNSVGMAGVNLSIPLYKGGKTMSGYRQAVAEYTAAQADTRQTRLDLLQKLAEAEANLALAQAEVEAYQAEVSAAKLAAYGTEREEELGERSLLDVLDAQQDVLDAQVHLVQARASVVDGVYAVLAARGQLVQVPPAIANAAE